MPQKEDFHIPTMQAYKENECKEKNSNTEEG